MYGGSVVESGPTRVGVRQPHAPLHAGPVRRPAGAGRTPARRPAGDHPGTVPELVDLPPGCPFAGRCRSRFPNAMHRAAGHEVAPASRCAASGWKEKSGGGGASAPTPSPPPGEGGMTEAAAAGREPRARLHAAAREAVLGRREGARAQRRELHHPGRPQPGHRRRVGLRQVDARAAGDGARPAHLRQRALLGPRPARLPREELRQARRDFQMVFQDPYGSLDPRQTVERIVCEPLARRRGSRDEQRKRATEALEAVGLRSQRPGQVPARVLRRPAPAHRHRPRPGHAAAPDRGRRTGERAGRLGAGAGAQPDAGPAGASSASPTC
jgi:energy-coupling factor transporter ATP-binding protein EcfA2